MTCFVIVKRVLAAVWAGFAPSVVLDFAKRALAAAWARFAPNFVVVSKGFCSAKRVVAAVWVGFAPSGLTKAWRWI